MNAANHKIMDRTEIARPQEIWRIEQFSHEMGTIVVATPVLKSGALDPMRVPRVNAQVRLSDKNTGQQGICSFQFGAGVSTLEQAVEGWPDAVRAEIEKRESAALRSAIMQPGKPS